MNLSQYSELIQETLEYIKMQNPHGWIFGTAEEAAFFQVLKKPAHIAPKRITPSSPSRVQEHTPFTTKVVNGSTAETAKASSNLRVAEVQRSFPSPQPPKSDEIRQILQKIAPALAISEQIPDDTSAKRIASAWKEKLPEAHIVLLVLDFLPETVELMKNLAKAMQKEFGSVKLMTGDRLEQEKRWDLFFEQNPLQLIVASIGIERYPELRKYYKMIPANQTAFLGETPLITLETASIYQHSAEKKLELWQTLCRMLKK